MPEYHAWTHRPKAQGGTDPIEAAGEAAYFRAYFMRYTGSPKTTAITGIGTTASAPVFDWWETNDSSVFVPRAATGSANPPVMSTDLIDKVRLYQVGHYHVNFHMQLGDPILGHAWHWTVTATTPFGLAESHVGGGDRHPSLTYPTGPLYNTVGWFGGSIVNIYPMPDYDGDPPDVYWPVDLGNGTVFVEGLVVVETLNQTSSNNNTIELCKLEIIFTPLTIPT